MHGRRCREGGVRRLGHLAFLRDVLSWLRWTRPGRARTSTSDVGRSHLPTEVSRDQPILFYSRFSHVCICLWSVIPDEETENEKSKMPEISKSATIQNSLFGRVVANRIRSSSVSLVSTSSGDGGWEVSCEPAHVHLISLGGFVRRRWFCASTAACASLLPWTNTPRDQTIPNFLQVSKDQPTFTAFGFRAGVYMLS
ncbi:hypothetical protein B0H14DRAFT_978811 [Mycena olivaceomarginata]|nr:hypothetical protein B0H14DRAFT_978811 [Mycena olivaceomarginata]